MLPSIVSGLLYLRSSVERYATTIATVEGNAIEVLAQHLQQDRSGLMCKTASFYKKEV
jgi:hypothetical protein